MDGEPTYQVWLTNYWLPNYYNEHKEALPKLKPCPFCGGEARAANDEYVSCLGCGALLTGASAITSWNTRTERTCEVDGAYSCDWWLDESSHIWTFELSCGHSIDSLWGEPPRYCPECGAKVVGA